jgi:hypothetical protein
VNKDYYPGTFYGLRIWHRSELKGQQQRVFNYINRVQIVSLEKSAGSD